MYRLMINVPSIERRFSEAVPHRSMLDSMQVLAGNMTVDVLRHGMCDLIVQ